jgi:nucleoside-diphosphate-sugar epimerase
MKYNNKPIAIVTGSSGFLGQHLTKTLKERDINPVTIPHDLLYDMPTLMNIIRSNPPRYIFSLHSYGNMHHHKEEDKIIMANYFATWNLLKATSFVDYSAFVHVSTSSVTLPYETFYSASKAGAERLCKAYATQFKKPIVIGRPYSLYGVGEASYRFIPTVFRSCLTGEAIALDPSPVHDWVLVDDFVEYLLSCADALEGMTQYSISEFGTGKGTTNGEVVRLIEAITGKKANITQEKQMRSYDTTSWVAGSSRVGMTSLEQGLQLIYEASL